MIYSEASKMPVWTWLEKKMFEGTNNHWMPATNIGNISI